MKSPIEIYVIGKVKEKRRNARISQSILAEMLHVSIGFIGQVESPRNSAKYNLNHLNDLAKIFNCQLGEFFPSKHLDPAGQNDTTSVVEELPNSVEN